eukprot:TRINITY_DN781797_c0_g1_i1.p1 TRINITY_DN781797_c0_g1~~TRINITY_DN781797_c0_g1_i1.p1  ORF type:complete len:216 (+),score=68.69 TRINITY_DN781797_c0_g1_i1:35-649(+)
MKVFIIALLLLVGVFAADEPAFAASNFFAGNWTLTSVAGETLEFKLNFDNDTLEFIDYDNGLKFTVFEDEVSGVFSTFDDYEDKELFTFEFSPLNGMMIAKGECHEENTVGCTEFSIVVFGQNQITLTFVEEGSMTLYHGVKTLEAREQTFFQKYGMFVMLGGMFMLQMFLKSKTQQGPRATGHAAPTTEEGATEETTEEVAEE